MIYQIWPQSFADADGDGTGDLPGITARLGYLAGLGVDAIWLSPSYRSPRADAGYDVADYRQIDPAFGTLEDLDDLLNGAYRLGLRVMIDLVPNHTSDQHTWFRQALASGTRFGRVQRLTLTQSSAPWREGPVDPGRSSPGSLGAE